MVGATNHMHLYFQKCIPSSFGKSGFCISAGYTRRLWEMKKNIMEKENMWYLWSPQYCYFTVINYRLVQSYNSPQIYKSHKADELMPLYFISWYKNSGKLLFLKKHKRSVGVAKGQQSNPPIYLFYFSWEAEKENLISPSVIVFSERGPFLMGFLAWPIWQFWSH